MGSAEIRRDQLRTVDEMRRDRIGSDHIRLDLIRSDWIRLDQIRSDMIR